MIKSTSLCFVVLSLINRDNVIYL